MDKRKINRVMVDDFTVDVSDGIGCCKGTVSDISKFGMCLENMTNKFRKDAKRLIVVISGKDEVFKMKVKPRWNSGDGFSTRIGAEIEETPWFWSEFVMGIDEKDVWGIR